MSSWNLLQKSDVKYMCSQKRMDRQLSSQMFLNTSPAGEAHTYELGGRQTSLLISSQGKTSRGSGYSSCALPSRYLQAGKGKMLTLALASCLLGPSLLYSCHMS